MHKTVLLKETIEGLNLNPKSLVIDCTFGGGGHSLEICKKYPDVKIIALDQDNSVWEKAKGKFEDLGCDLTFVNANFRDLGNLQDFRAYALGDTGQGTHDAENLVNFPVDGIILDLGLSSDQLETSGRGFSFTKDEPLLMQMKNSAEENPSEEVTARDVVNTWSEKSLADIIYGYGEEKFAKRIARGIVEAREKKKIETTLDLVKIIEGEVPAVYKRGKLHCATRTFQAIRIAVNDELGALSEGLQKGFKALKVGGRMSVISFHSLEDRIVKKFYKQKEKEGVAILIPARNATHSVAGGNKKVITPSSEELKNNPRARSAKLRIINKI